MSKANEKAFEKYTVSIDETWKDRNKRPRIAYIEGYHQAEKDNELTWEDIMIIHKCIKDAMNYHLYAFQTMGGQQKVYEDVLRRFREMKEK